MDKKIIFEKIEKARLQRYITNCYSMDVVEHSTDVWSHGDEFIFSYEDHGVERLVYFAKDWDSVNRLIDEVGSGSYYLEFMTKNPGEYRPEKTTQVAAMMRLSNADCRCVFEADSPVLQYKEIGRASCRERV